MAAYLAHEVNNPLGGVKNAALLIRRFPDDPAKQVRYLDLLDQGVARIQEVIRSLVDLYQPVQPTDTLDVRECVQELQRLMARTLEARGLTLETTLTHGVRLPSQEGEILRQVAFNLLRNAAEASPPGGKVSLVLSLAEQRLVLEVMDEGPGIPDERQADLWNSGYSTKRATVAGGLTLGLALSRRLLRDLGGDLVLAPHSPGRGAHFSILLPLAPMKAADPSSSSAVP
jgi:signal transduction histidine kinase